MSRACDAISDVLMANGNDCGLLEDPTTAGPTLPNEDHRDDLRLEVSGLTPAYDGIKAVILGMVNMTEGLPWPLKAIPQTVLQIVKHVENGRAAAARITELLAEVQSQWTLVAEWNGSDIGNERLRPHIEAFFDSSAIDRVEGQIGSLVAAVNGVAELVTPAAASTTDGNISRIPPPQPHMIAANIAILGAGGIGKTSLALAVLHSERIVTAVITALAKLFSVTTTNEPLQAIVSHLASQPHTILVLDNLETVWLVRDDIVRSQTELLLRHLGAIKTLSLVITCRAIAAIKTFDEIAGTSESDAESERTAVVDLITAVDCMPLAVSLLAELVQCGNKPFELLSHWNKSHTAMLQTYPNGRESNVAASIKLLAICAHLPSGVRPTVFDQLKPHFEDLDSACRCLRSFALISAGSEGELKMLSPIRHFVLKAHPMTADHHAAMRQIYFDIAASAPIELSEEFTNKSTAVAAEYENLNVFLLHLINTEEPSQSLVDAVSAVSAYAYYSYPSVTLLVALRSRLDGHELWLAQCCRDIGRIYVQLIDYESASKALLQASEILNTIGDRRQAAYCAILLGDCQCRQGFYEMAVQQHTAARDIFIEVQDHTNASVCLMRLGDIAISRGEYEDAKQYLTSARSTFRGESEDLVYAAECTSSLGLIYSKEGNFAIAETELRTAQSEFQAMGYQYGLGQCMGLLGDLRRRQRDFSSAEKLLFLAREHYNRVGDQMGQASCIYDVGLLRRDQGRTQEALEAFRTAAQIYERIGVAEDLEDCHRAIENLDNVQI
ncbi:hypothetical protein BKA62DRAFT_834779 [Auriculariales sp. MPI-PUGE-AT-0066]|nr:hypothetical protein BKA62DRAFT_834779 [Auriculariales sp. MPI-PUGE-AT-0066]